MTEQANSPPSRVTAGPLPAAERMRRMRDRKKAGFATPLMYERADYQLFMRPETLPQKAGCEPHQIGRVVVKELVDNALDNGAEVTLAHLTSGKYRISDNGSGIDLSEVPRLAVNRPLLSSKLKRLPLRGMLGNGLRVVMGAVAAYGGTITITTRGHCLSLAVDTIDGTTQVVSDEAVPMQPGTTIEIGLPPNIFTGMERQPADMSIAVAHEGATSLRIIASSLVQRWRPTRIVRTGNASDDHGRRPGSRRFRYRR
jgi:hypothetical protein